MDSKRIMASFVFAGLALIASQPAFAAIDLTAYLRSLGAENYSIVVSSGEEYNGMAKGAFDGDISTDPGRALMLHGSSKYKYEPTIELHAHPVDEPDSGLRVSSFRLYRLNSGGSLYNERTIHDFAIQASVDGDSWATIYRTPEKQVWTDDTPYRDYEISPSRQGCFSCYRIKMYPDYSASSTEEDDYLMGFQELVLYGEIEKFKEWNGADGERWDSQTPNWTNLAENAAASVWRDGVQANFMSGCSDVIVDGVKQVNGVVFGSDSECNISGSRLELFPSSRIIVGGSATIGNDLCNTGSLMEVAHTGWLPRDDSNSKQGKRVCLWRNRRLTELTFTGATIRHGNNQLSALPYHVSYEEDGTTVQFQTKYTTGDRFVVFCFKVLFEQDGADVYGKILWVKFKWDTYEPGHDFDDGNSYTSGDVFDDANNSGYGLKDIAATGGDGSSPLVIRSCPLSNSCYPHDECLPRSEEDDFTGSPVVYWKNRRVEDIAEVLEGGFLAHGAEIGPVNVHYFSNDGTVACAQFQALMPSGSTYVRVCVKVEFTQSGKDVAACVKYAKYNWTNLDVHDFDGDTGKMEVREVWLNDAGNTMAHGYSVRGIKVRFKGELTLTGKLGIEGDITVCENTVLTLGADSLTLDNSYAGDGSVRFASQSGSAQTVTVNAARSMADVVVDGELVLNIADGASLSVSDLSFGPDASLSVTTDPNAGTFKVGTEKCLGSTELSKIKMNGHSVYQGDDGVLLRKPGLVLTIQ